MAIPTGTFNVGGGGRANGKAATPKSSTPKAGTSAWKTFTANRWHQHHPYAGQEGRDPVTGDPVMKSIHQIRAESNAAAWKSVAAQQAALPQVDTGPYDAQRANINALVQAHRSWLESAGQYQVEMANKLGAMAGATVQGADAVTGGQMALAGAAPGSAPSTNVSPAAISAPVSYGSNFGAYLASLLPAATAMGLGNTGQVDAAQAAAMKDRADSAKQIAGTLADTQENYFKDYYGLALDNYKSELAALADKDKTTLDTQKFKEDVRYHTGLLGLSEDRNTIANNRAQNAITKTGLPTAGDSSGLRSALSEADLIMHPKPSAGGTKTTKVPTRYSVMYTIPGYTTSQGVVVQPVRKPFSGNTPDAVRKQVKAFLNNPANQGKGWTPAAGNSGIIEPTKGYTKDVTKSTAAGTPVGDQYQLRQRAWRYLVAHNAALLHPVDKQTLLGMFRAMEGAPQ